jgi:DeoR family transcriptional regulator of aga operon
MAVSAARAAAEKRAIGLAAAALVAPGASVIFDSGSTVAAAARAALARRVAMTAVTNDLAIAQMLASGETVRVLTPGGAVRPGSTTILGEPGPAFWAGIHADVAFVGAHAVAGGWLADTALDVAAAKRAMIAAARRVVALVDGAKFAQPTFCRIAPVTAVHDLITDAGAPPEAVAALREAGVAVTVVSPR